MVGMRIVRLGCVCALAAPLASAAGERSPLRVARDGLRFEPDAKGRIALGDVLKRFEEVGDWTLVMDDETRARVDGVTFWVSGPIEAEPDAVPLVVDALLANAAFTWSVVPDESPLHLEVRSRDDRKVPKLEDRALAVPADEIQRYAEHAALLVETRVSMPNRDVRTLRLDLFALVVDPAVLQILPLADSSELEILGTARSVADVVELLRMLDPSVGKASEHPVPLPSTGDSATLRAAASQGPTMLTLVREYARTTGQVAVVNEEVLRPLNGTRPRLEQPLSASGAEFGSLAEAAFTDMNDVVVELLRDAPRLCCITDLDTTARGTVRSSALVVDPTSVPDCARRPATFFATIAHFPHVDLRAAATILRAEDYDGFVRQIVPIADTDAILLVGRGKDLAAMFQRLSTLEAQAARAAGGR